MRATWLNFDVRTYLDILFNVEILPVVLVMSYQLKIKT